MLFHIRTHACTTCGDSVVENSCRGVLIWSLYALHKNNVCIGACNYSIGKECTYSHIVRWQLYYSVSYQLAAARIDCHFVSKSKIKSNLAESLGHLVHFSLPLSVPLSHLVCVLLEMRSVLMKCP